ncbi:MAG: hypothetical protein ACSHXK_11990 [Oceanococcus sp.]
MNKLKTTGRRKLLRWLLLCIVVLPGIPFILGSLGIVLFANWPSPNLQWTVTPLPLGAQNLTLVTHGKGGNADGWVSELVANLSRPAPPSSFVVGVDWHDASYNLFRCSVNGARIGERLAKDVLANNPELRRVHFIAHSAGSFMAYSFCQTIKKASPEIHVKTTYLDPSSIYRGIDWTYGTRHFGNCSDESEAYYNVGDGAPGSEQALQHAQSHDITALKPSGWSNGHLWPVEYYLQRSRGLLNTHENNESKP